MPPHNQIYTLSKIKTQIENESVTEEIETMKIKENDVTSDEENNSFEKNTSKTNELNILQITNQLENIKLKEEQITIIKNQLDDTYEIDEDNSDSENYELDSCTSINEKSPGKDEDRDKRYRHVPYSIPREFHNGGSYNEQTTYNYDCNRPSTSTNCFNNTHMNDNGSLTQHNDSHFNNITLPTNYYSVLSNDPSSQSNILDFNIELSSPVSFASSDEYIQPNLFDQTITNEQFLLLNTNTQDDYINIPSTITYLNDEEQIPVPKNNAEMILSKHIDQNKKRKQEIWIHVNIKTETELINTLQKKISKSNRFTAVDLNYIYAIIIRLMKDGKHLLIKYITFENEILLKVALKNNVLLLNFIIEVMQNLGINPSEHHLLHEILAANAPTDLSDILEAMLNIKFIEKPSVHIFDLNTVDRTNQSLLMIILKSISLGLGNLQTNVKYLDILLRHKPDLNYITPEDGRNIFHHAIEWNCSADILRKIISSYDRLYLNNLMAQPDFNGFTPFHNNIIRNMLHNYY